ncbi:vascular non-inflammatory molecule 3-like [Babylonia areolata]|uniref:vascular non-inflammatory molecule 3-like n=1 Tax=Babylonia areolata TaxID=304850 RepID=UPI003FD32C82
MLWALVSIFTTVAYSQRPELPGFTAAVYAHRPIIPPPVKVLRDVAIKNMMKNIDIYRQQAKLAKSKGAHIVVYPENGLYGYRLSRDAIRPYLEPVPEPQDSSHPTVPCSHPVREGPSEVFTALSCIARENELYVVANMGSIQSCEDNVTGTCPPDLHYHYNTDVVFDPSGQLIARYHKRALFREPQFDVPPVEVVTFDTPFGRFGLLTCFDILFWDPAVRLVEEQGIDHVAFPTGWMDRFPLLTAVGFHSAWARRLGVTLLTSNLHLPEINAVGSGVYTATGPLAVYYNHTPGSQGRLVIAHVPPASSQRSCPRKQGANDIDHSEAGICLPHPQQTTNQTLPSFTVNIAHDQFQMVLMDESLQSGSVSVCKGDFCCSLSYERKPPWYGNFALGAYQGVHRSARDWHYEACLLVPCVDRSPATCGQPTSVSGTVFFGLALSGTFSTTSYVYPEVLVSVNGQIALPPPPAWRTDKDGTLRASGLTHPLLVAALYARDYTKDPQHQAGHSG